jgi:hypothetical protein
VFNGKIHEFHIHEFIPAARHPFVLTHNGLMRREKEGWKKTGDLNPHKSITAWAETDDALWLAGGDPPLWRVPFDGGPAAGIGWEQQFPLPEVMDLFVLNDGRLLAGAQNCGFTIFSPQEAGVPAPARERVQIEEIKCPYPPLRDSAGVLYFMNPASEQKLRWRDTQWHETDFPAAFSGVLTPMLDTKGRFWVIARSGREVPGPCAVFDRKTESWQVYEDWGAAVLAHHIVPAGGLTLDLEPVYAGDGRAAFLSRKAIFYYDGRAWRTWWKQAVGGKDWIQGYHVCFFDEKGRFCVQRKSDLYRWANGRWNFERATESPTLPAEYREFTERQAQLRHDEEHAITDPDGFAWFVRDERLWRKGLGLELPVFPEDTATPFADGRRISRLWRDLAGGVFFETFNSGNSFSSSPMVYMPAPEKKPETTVTAYRLEANDVHIEAKAENAAAFAWRFEGGPWREAVRENTFTIEALPDGEHAIEVAALNPWFETDPAPEKIKIGVSYLRNHIDTWLNELQSGSYEERNRAAAHLIEAGMAALPRLKAALAFQPENSEARWWLEAAIQRIQDQQE